MTPRSLPRCCLLLAGLSLAASARAENWPQWRGPNNDGVSTEKNLPSTWGAEKNVAWKFEIPGKGSSTPAVWGDRIFLTSEEGKKVLLLCVGTDGKQKWKRDLGAAVTPSGRGAEGNCASPSPSTDGKAVYAFAGNGEFAAFDLQGKELWRFNAQKRYGKFEIAFGIHSTPVLFKDHLYFQLIHEGAAVVVCVKKSDGTEVWKVDRESDGKQENLHGYASPFMWSNGKDAYLVSHGNDYAIAHDLKDGKEIWRVGELNPKRRYRGDLRFVASPVCTPELIVVPSAKNHGVVGVAPTEAKGKMTGGAKGEKWRLRSGTPDVPCPLVYDGLVYLGGENGGITCLEAETGKQVYKLDTADGAHRASLVYGDGKIYQVARDGTASVVKAGKQGKLLHTNRLPDVIPASPVVSGGRIYLRGYKYLWAIEEKK